MSVVPFSPSRLTAQVRRAEPEEPWLALWLRRLRARHALAALDRDQMREAGLDPFQVRAEIEKPFWRA